MNESNLPKLKKHHRRRVKPINKLLADGLVLSIVTIIGTLSYAYFTTIGATSEQAATISTAKVQAIFSDTEEVGSNATLNFGESFTKKFTITNNGNVPTHVKMYWKNLVNTYTKESLSYTLSKSTTENGTYSEIPIKGEEKISLVPQAEKEITKLLADDIEIPVGVTYYELKVTLNYLPDVNQDSDLEAKFYSWFELEDINYYENAIERIIASSKGPLMTGFDNPASTAESAGVYELEDEGNTTSYYFRGPVENNYVRFGRWANIEENGDKAGKDMYWRVIRINGDGSLRMIYSGTQAWANDNQFKDDVFIKNKQSFNPAVQNTCDAKYVGYMYSPSGTTASISIEQAQKNTVNSDIKIIVDEWYQKNLKAEYDQYISKDAIFCNDRSMGGTNSTWTNKGFGTQSTNYAARTRLYSGALGYKETSPSFLCSQDNDKFTAKEAITGNKALTYPVGLITADEVVAAGKGEYSNLSSSFYLKRAHYWTMTPNISGGANTAVFLVSTTTVASSVANTYGVAPVINLTPEYAATMIYGTGEMNDPYHA